MKKLVLTLTLFLAIFTLSACTINPGEEDPDLGISINLESNIESVNPTLLRLSNSATDVISVGDQVTASAPDVDGYRFVYWLHKELTIIMSNDQDYTFTVSRDVTLRAIYEEIPSETPVDLTLESNLGSASLSVSNDSLNAGDSVTVTTENVEGYVFDGWYSNDVLVSEELNYTFTIETSMTLEARFSVIDTNTNVSLTLTSNIEGVDFGIIPSELVAGETVTVTAETMNGYTFVGWYQGDTLLSSDLSYTFTINDDLTLNAVYQADATEETILVDFEDASKASYAEGTITIGDFDYILSDALVGNLDNDQKNDAWAVRIREGFVETDFYLTNIKDVSFYIGRYLGDSASSITIEVSSDGINYTLVDTINVDAWTLVSYDFVAVYSDLSIDPSTPLRIKLTNQTGERVNLDDLSITYLSSGSIDPNPPGEEVTLTLTSNVSAGVHANPSGPYVEGDEVTIIAPIINGYTFEYWLNLSDDSIFTSVPNYTFDLLSDLNLQAVYSEIVDPGDSSEVNFTIHPDTVYHFSLGDTVVNYPCEATLIETGETLTCTQSGNVNTNAIGEYTITYTATDGTNSYTYPVTKVVLKDATLLELTLSSYYADAIGLYGEDLLIALRNIINDGFNGVTYGEARYILDETDQDPNNVNNLILIYRQTSINGTWDAGATWNREHIWPQSLLGEDANNSQVNIASDLHNLAPANPSENSSRGNKYFFTSNTSDAYYPEEAAARGYLARALFYMITMYDHLELVNDNPTIFEMGHLDTLLLWHFTYNVTSFEENRNDIIYSYQGNRNPFIDYPHLVELIYWNHPDVLTWE